VTERWEWIIPLCDDHKRVREHEVRRDREAGSTQYVEWRPLKEVERVYFKKAPKRCEYAGCDEEVAWVELGRLELPKEAEKK